MSRDFVVVVVFFNDTATTEIYTLSLHDALPILLIDIPLLAQMQCDGSYSLVHYIYNVPRN